jgi:hypothetical protein
LALQTLLDHVRGLNRLQERYIDAGELATQEVIDQTGTSVPSREAQTAE